MTKLQIIVVFYFLYHFASVEEFYLLCIYYKQRIYSAYIMRIIKVVVNFLRSMIHALDDYRIKNIPVFFF